MNLFIYYIYRLVLIFKIQVYTPQYPPSVIYLLLVSGLGKAGTWPICDVILSLLPMPYQYPSIPFHLISPQNPYKSTEVNFLVYFDSVCTSSSAVWCDLCIWLWELSTVIICGLYTWCWDIWHQTSAGNTPPTPGGNSRYREKYKLPSTMSSHNQQR